MQKLTLWVSGHGLGFTVDGIVMNDITLFVQDTELVRLIKLGEATADPLGIQMAYAAAFVVAKSNMIDVTVPDPMGPDNDLVILADEVAAWLKDFQNLILVEDEVHNVDLLAAFESWLDA